MPIAPYSASDLALAEPAPLYFRRERVDAHTGYAPHRHRWGQLNRINLGLIEISVGDSKLIAPAEYIVWIPAELPHAAYIKQALDYTSVYVASEWAQRLPPTASLIAQTPLIRALFDDFAQRQIGSTAEANEQVQAQLLLQRLCQAEQRASYLPSSSHRQLAAILQTLHANPGDSTSLAQWAAQVHTSERTLARQFQKELGMSFVQWRNRLRLLSALAQLKEGQRIQDIAWQLGYGHPSAFIAMFRQQTGLSPERYRRQLTSD
jgi:AraC-like DNA-binding protein